MAHVKAFEDLIAWQKAMDVAVDVYTHSDRHPFARDFAMRDQVHRAAMSVPSNIAEGFERGSRAEFHRFLGIAKGSCGELSTQLQLAARLSLIDTQSATTLVERIREVSRIVGKLRSNVGRQRSESRPRPTRTSHLAPRT